MNLPRAPMSDHWFHVFWWDNAVECTNPYKICDFDGVLDCGSGEDQDDECNVQE